MNSTALYIKDDFFNSTCGTQKSYHNHINQSINQSFYFRNKPIYEIDRTGQTDTINTTQLHIE